MALITISNELFNQMAAVFPFGVTLIGVAAILLSLHLHKKGDVLWFICGIGGYMLFGTGILLLAAKYGDCLVAVV